MPIDLSTIGIVPNARTFALKMQGDSMTGVHILNGDILILEMKPPGDGATVAALIDGECVVRGYFVRRGIPYPAAVTY